MQISTAGVDLIKKFEGLKLKAYLPTPNDVPTIGYGHTKTAKMGTKITKKEATALLVQDLAWCENAVGRAVKVPLTQSQYDALCSFTYNLGETNLRSSTLLKVLNKGDYEEAANQLLRWDKQGKKTLLGLTRRREAEKAMFLSEPNVTTQAKPKSALEALLGALMAFLKAITSNRSD